MPCNSSCCCCCCCCMYMFSYHYNSIAICVLYLCLNILSLFIFLCFYFFFFANLRKKTRISFIFDVLFLCENKNHQNNSKKRVEMIRTYFTVNVHIFIILQVTINTMSTYETISAQQFKNMLN